MSSSAIYQQFPTLHFHSLLPFISNFLSLAVIRPNSTDFASDANVSGIVESRVSADQRAPVLPIHPATSRRISLLPPYSRFAGSDIPICPREPAAMEPRDTIREPDVHNTPLSPAYTQPGSVLLVSTSLGTKWGAMQLRESSISMSHCTVSISRKCDLLIIFVSKLQLIPVNRASFKFVLLFPVITLVSLTAWKFIPLIFMHVGYFSHKRPLPIRPSPMLMNNGKLGSLIVPISFCEKDFDTNIPFQAAWDLLWG